MIWFGEGCLRKGIAEFVAHYRTVRNHQGLDNQLIIPDTTDAGNRGRLRRRERLGGLLNHIHCGACKQNIFNFRAIRGSKSAGRMI